MLNLYSTGEEIRENSGPHMISFDTNFFNRTVPPGNKADLPTTELNELRRFAEYCLDREIPLEKVREKITSLEANLREGSKRLKARRRNIIDQFGVNSNENTDMMQEDQTLEFGAYFLAEVLKKRRSLTATRQNFRPKYNLVSGGNTTFPPEKTETAGNGLVCIDSAKITSFDTENRIYTGEIRWRDFLERCNPTSKWVAHTTPAGVNFRGKEELYIRNAERFLSGYEFSLLPALDAAMRRYIMPLINELESKFLK